MAGCHRWSVAGGGNGSTSTIKNISNNRFWETLKTNLVELLRETDKVLPEGGLEPEPQRAAAIVPARAAASGSAGAQALASTAVPATARRSTFREAASVIANPETGNISVRATQSQHARVREFLDRVLLSARRQVLIEATIVEVDLSSRFQQGIDWSLLRTAGSSAGTPSFGLRGPAPCRPRPSSSASWRAIALGRGATWRPPRSMRRCSPGSGPSNQPDQHQHHPEHEGPGPCSGKPDQHVRLQHAQRY